MHELGGNNHPDGLPVTTIYDIPPCMWNGPRKWLAWSGDRWYLTATEDAALHRSLPLPRQQLQVKSRAPCSHRGLVMDSVHCGCGSRGKTVPVYACSIHGECLENNTGKAGGKKYRVCATCPDRS